MTTVTQQTKSLYLTIAHLVNGHTKIKTNGARYAKKLEACGCMH